MPTQDWYPSRLSARPEWHANFSTQAAATGTDYGLTAPQVTQIASDAANVALISNYVDAVDAHAQAVTAWKNTVLESTIGTPLPDPPTVPAAPTPIGTLAAITARTRQYVGVIKASPAFTPEVGEAYGLVAPEPAGVGVPSLVCSALTGSQVQLSCVKAGFTLLAVDSRRGGGAWEQIGVAQTSTFLDVRAPLTVGQPELREFRVQGLAENVRSGAASAVVSAVTVP